MQHYIESEPRMDGRGSSKFETGKRRSIYATSMPDYVVGQFALAPVEACLSIITGIEKGSQPAEALSRILDQTRAKLASYNSKLLYSFKFPGLIITVCSKLFHEFFK